MARSSSSRAASGESAASNGDIVVDTDRGSLRGDAVVLAAGSWSGEIAIEGVAAGVPVRPVRGQLLYLGVERVAAAARHVELRAATWCRGTTARCWSARRWRRPDSTSESRLPGVRDLLDAACEIVPHAWTASFAGARAGLRPGTADGLPVIGASQVLPNLMYATGHYRNGVLLAPLTAQLVADAMLDDRVDPALAAVRPGAIWGVVDADTGR